MSFRDIENLRAERGVIVSYEPIPRWCLKFGPKYHRSPKRREGRLGDVWHVNKVFMTFRGQIRYLWRAVDQDGDVIDILVQQRRNALTANPFFNRALQGQGAEPLVLITDRLRSYPPAVREYRKDNRPFSPYRASVDAFRTHEILRVRVARNADAFAMSHARSKIVTGTGGFVDEKATGRRSREDGHERDRAVARQRMASFLKVRGMG